MVTLQQIKDNLQDVTPEQINKCQKVIDLQTNKDFYMVESSDGTEDYKVRYDPEKGFSCTCAAGQAGFSKITRHPSGVCKHVRWAFATWLEDEAMEQAYQEAQEAMANKVAKQPTLVLPIVKPLPVSSIEESLPEWLKRAKPAPHMRQAPREY